MLISRDKNLLPALYRRHLLPWSFKPYIFTLWFGEEDYELWGDINRHGWPTPCPKKRGHSILCI